MLIIKAGNLATLLHRFVSFIFALETFPYSFNCLYPFYVIVRPLGDTRVGVMYK